MRQRLAVWPISMRATRLQRGVVTLAAPRCGRCAIGGALPISGVVIRGTVSPFISNIMARINPKGYAEKQVCARDNRKRPAEKRDCAGHIECCERRAGPFITLRTRWGRPDSECSRQSRELRVKAAQQLLTRLRADSITELTRKAG